MISVGKKIWKVVLRPPFFVSFRLPPSCLPSFSKTMAHQKCPAGPLKAVLCAIRNISLGVEHEMCPGGVFGEGWVCHCLVGKGRPLGCEGRPGNSCTFLQFTVGGNLGWKCLYKGVLPTMQQICFTVGATIPCRVL